MAIFTSSQKSLLPLNGGHLDTIPCKIFFAHHNLQTSRLSSRAGLVRGKALGTKRRDLHLRQLLCKAGGNAIAIYASSCFMQFLIPQGVNYKLHSVLCLLAAPEYKAVLLQNTSLFHLTTRITTSESKIQPLNLMILLTAIGRQCAKAVKHNWLWKAFAMKSLQKARRAFE